MNTSCHSIISVRAALRMLVAFFAISVSGSTIAAPANDAALRKAKAEEVFVLATAGIDQKTIFQTATDAASGAFAGAPEAAIKEGRVVMDQMMSTLWSDYRAFFVKSYASEFTAAELDQVVALFKITRSPVMAKFQNFQTTFDTASKQTLADLNTRFAATLSERLKAIVAKHGDS